MLRTVLSFILQRPWSSRPPCCERTGRARWVPLLLVTLLALLLALAALLPRAARAEASETADPLADVVAEAFFLNDALPPGGHELSLIVAGAPDARGSMDVDPAVELAFRPGARVGLIASFVVDPNAGAQPYARYASPVHSPAGALRLLLRSPEGGALGVATCLEVVGPGPGRGLESALGLGIIQALGPVALRAGASVTTPVAAWEPRLHAGFSAATQLGARLRLLGEAIVEMSDGTAGAWAGPTAKVDLRPDASLAVGALLDLRDPGAPPRFVTQLTMGL